MKGQISLEYMVVFAFVIIVFTLLFSAISTQRSTGLSDQVYAQLQLDAQKIASQINTAATAGDGFSVLMPITTKISALTYNVSVGTNGAVVLQAKVGTEILQAIAYAMTTNITASSSYLVSNNVYLLPTSNGTISIKNNLGTICIDYDCPTTSSQASHINVYNSQTQVMQMNGKSTVIDLGNDPQLNFGTGDFSVSAWVNVNSFAGTPYILTKENCISGNPGFIVGFSPSAQLYVDLNDGNGYGLFYLGAASGLKTNKWYNVVFSFTRSGQLVTYVNGVEYAAATISNKPYSISNSFNAHIGAYVCTVPSGAFFDGQMANLQVYNSAIPANTVTNIYNSGIGGSPQMTANLVGWWPLNGNLKDNSGYGYDGTPSGSPIFPTVSQFSAKVTNAAGQALDNVLVGFTSTLGNLSKEFVGTNYTNANGIANLFVSQSPDTTNNGKAYVTATAFNGNTATQGNLIAWWPMNTNKGSTAFDLSGSNLNGNMLGGATWSVTRQVADLSKGSFIGVPSSSSLDITGPITMLAWVKPTTYAGDTDMQTIMTKSISYYMQLSNSGKIAFYLGGTTMSGYVYSANPIPLNKFSLVAVTYDGASANVYINGVLGSSTGVTGTITNQCDALGIGANLNCYNGLYHYPYNREFSGQIADAQVYNTALSQQQIQSIYNQGLSALPVAGAGNVGWWPLNGDAIDYSGTGNNGIVNGPVSFVSASQYANYQTNSSSYLVGNFDGASSYINGGTGTNMGTTNSVTLSAWIYPYSIQSSSYYGLKDIIAMEQHGGASNINYGLQLTSSTSVSFVKRTGTESIILYTFTVPPMLDTWSHVVLSAANGVASLYVDGTLVGSQSISSSGFSPTSGQNFVIGSLPGGYTYFNGLISNVQVYNASLSANEISGLYSKGMTALPLTNVNLLAWYPLNGNANDYSKAATVGVPTNMNYVSQIISSPSLINSYNNYGVNFNGDNGYVLSSNPASLQIGSGTIAAWIKTSHTGPSYNGIIVKQNAYAMFLKDNQFGTYDWSGGGFKSTGVTLNDSQWHFVAATFQSGVSGGTNLYIDGQNKLSTTITINAQTQQLVLGSGSSGGSQFFNGIIADAQVYNSVLTSNQIYQLYKAQLPPHVDSSISLGVTP